MADLLLPAPLGHEILVTSASHDASTSARGPHMDLNISAFRIVQNLTTETKDDKRVAAARVGGKAGGPARARKLSSERRREIALKANKARWKREGSKS